MAITHGGFRFGPFRLETDARVLWRDGEVVPLPPRAIDVLEALVERHGDVVLKEELMGRVWAHAPVEEANLSVNVSLVRRALGKQADGRPWVETVPRRGYRFLARAEPLGAGRRRSLAILPFRRLGPTVEDDYMGDALADALITRLVRQGRVTVRPTATALRFADRDPEEAGREMAVDGVLTGNLQQEGKRLRVTAQLVPLIETLEPWAGAFEEEVTNLFAVEDAMARQLARALGLEEERSGPTESAARRSPPPDLEAYQAYMKGRYFWNRLTGESLGRAFACFQEAAEKDPSYAPPHSGLADGHLLAGLVGLLPPRQAWDLAEIEARAALERDETLAEAHVSLAYLRLFRDWDFTGAQIELGRALELSPQSVAVYQWMGVLLHLRGRPEDASAAISEARKLDPASAIVHAIEGLRHTLGRDADAGTAQYAGVIDLDPHQFVGHWGLGLSLTYAGRHEEAVASLRRAAELAGGMVPVRAALGWGLAAAGQGDEAHDLLRELERPADGAWTSPYQRAIIHAALGEMGRALACLEEACEARDAWAVWIAVDPMLDVLRDDPRFADVAGPILECARA